MQKVIKKCKRCDESLTSKYSKIYCNKECYDSGPRGRRKTRKKMRCFLCAKEFTVIPSNPAKFCSMRCSRAERHGRSLNRINGKQILISKKCPICPRLFQWPQGFTYQKKYCSKKCELTIGRARIRQLGIANRKYTPEQAKERALKQGRQSYRRHIETRLFYYRKLSAIRKNIKGDFSKEQWNNIIKRQKNKCIKCRKPMSKPTIDHVIPISKWEVWTKTNHVSYECNDIENVQAMCSPCNSSKSNKL